MNTVSDFRPTHEVFNQGTTLVDYNLFTSNVALQDALTFNLPLQRVEAARTRLGSVGAALGKAETLALGDAANRSVPVLKTHDRHGNRRDEVEFHPAWHELMTLAMKFGLHSGAWSDGEPGAHVERAAAYLMFSEVETGVLCPITMTYGAVPVLRAEPDIATAWLPRILSRDYDPRFIPAGGKHSMLVGMGMTEKQGGSDVRANTTRAAPASGGAYTLIGHKWFFSAPMCDAFLVLAHAPGGLSCFLLPRFTPDGALNAIRIQRLKDKLGNRSNASAEVEFHEAHATLVGEEGRGVQTILQMGVYTRLDCALGTAGLMRQALAQALHNARERQVFGKLLKDQPLMKNVLADLALESEAATALGLRLANAYDKDDESERLLRRALTPAAKFWVCKRGAHFAQEAMEAIGGNGYVEESILPRIYREMPVNSIWEGAGNVMCLDVIRALSRSPDVGNAVLAELDAVRGSHADFDRFAASLATRMVPGATDEAGARRLTQDIALGVQASVLARAAPGFVFEAFVGSRLASPCTGGAFGMLPADAPLDRLIERAMPASDKIDPKARAVPQPRRSAEQSPPLEKLSESVGDLLRDQHSGLERIAFNRVPIRTGNAAIQLQSDAFDDNQPMPMRYTADGAGASPPLQWSGVPDGAGSLVLLVEDPDAPIPQPFVHAIVVGLPPRDGSLYEGELQRAGRNGRLKLGRNSFLQATWLPPDPPRGHGVHRYAFQLFALKDSPPFADTPGRDEVEEALRRSAIASGCLVGTYERTSTR